MGDIKRFLLRLPAELFDTLTNEATGGKVSLNRLIVERLSSVPGAVSGKVNVGPKASGVTRAKSRGIRVTGQAAGLTGSNPVAELQTGGIRDLKYHHPPPDAIDMALSSMARQNSAVAIKRCPECFAGGGMHQKGCSLCRK